jgi:putative molybdopterin biosynthesis protein
MSIYLHDIPLAQAKAALDEALQAAMLGGILGVEDIPLDERALGRVLAEPVWAKISSPHYHAAAMDGFAVRAADTEGARLTAPLDLPQPAKARYVDTGDPLPAWADAVIPIEETEPLDPAANPRACGIRIRAALPPWKHVRPLGEDMVASELVLPAGHTLRPVDLGACAGSGNTSLRVARRPRVALIPTGTELKPIGEPVGPGEIIEYNSVVLAAQIASWGGEPTRLPIIPDEFEEIKAAVQAAAHSADLVLLLSGSSAGAEDFSARVMAAAGELLVHGVAVRPGHPVILGMLPAGARRVPLVGVPGYPVSAALTGEIFVEPLLARWLGRAARPPRTLAASLTRKVTSPSGDDDYLRVAVGSVGGQMLAAPIARGAGVISSLVRADGIVIIPRGSQGLPAGAQVSVQLYRGLEEVSQTIFAIGSHDVALDVLAQHLAERGRRLASSNAGSLGGLLALRRGEAHLAGSHLLDPETGDYNAAAIRDYLPGVPLVLVGFVGREQGLMVAAGNPQGIRRFADLARPGVTFVNRQRGAGTRVLLDYELAKAGISPEAVRGYGQEEYTHLSVAAAVASGRADCGLGIPAAARALGLDFVPLAQERYDLIIPAAHYNSPLLAPLRDVMQADGFRNAVAALPGYDVSPMGTIFLETG